MKILITGGAGFIGSNLAREAVRRGWGVRVLDSFFLGSLKNLSGIADSIEIIKDAVDNEKTVDAATRGVDYIFHEAAVSSSQMFLRDPRIGVSVNVKGIINLLHSAHQNGVRRIIYASTSSIYGALPTPQREDIGIIKCPNQYAATKLASEYIAKAYTLEHGLETVGLRYFSIYGPGEEPKGEYANMVSQFLWDMKKGKRPVIYGDGNQTRDFVFVNDVVRANFLAMKKPVSGEVFNVGSGKATTINTLVNLLNKCLGMTMEPVYVKNPIKNYVKHTLADTSKAKKLLKFEPRTPLKNGIEKLVEHYQSAKK
jgi:nucleoside-diphosphate-sugar epimerase